MDLLPRDPDKFGLDNVPLLTEYRPAFETILNPPGGFEVANPDGWEVRKVGTKVSGPVWSEGKGRSADLVYPVAPGLDELSAYQHRYWSVDFKGGESSEDPEQPVSRPQAELEEAHTWSSELVDAEGNRTGYHTVMLDIDHPVRVLPSSTTGHYHLYIDVPVEETKYFDALDALAKAGIVEQGYVEASRARAGTHLRLPWVKKNAEFFETEEEAEAAEKNVGGRSGVLHAIPESLATGIAQSKAGEVAPLDWRSMPDAREPYDDLAAQIAENAKDATGRSLSLEPAAVTNAGDPSEDTVARRLSLAEQRLADARLALAKPEEFSWNVDEYEVHYVDGKGVLRRKKAKSQLTHPEA